MEKQKLGPRQQAWVDALRSGKYEQGRSYLKNGGAYYCLGVACAINPELVKDFDWGPLATLPIEVVEYLGVRDSVGEPISEHLKSLVALNDKLRWSFSKIADQLENDAESYFLEPR